MFKFDFRRAPMVGMVIALVAMCGFYVVAQFELESLYSRYNDKLIQNQVMNDVVRQLLHEAGTPADEAWDIASDIERLAPQTRGVHGLESREVLEIARASSRSGKRTVRLRPVSEKNRVVAPAQVYTPLGSLD